MINCVIYFQQIAQLSEGYFLKFSHLLWHLILDFWVDAHSTKVIFTLTDNSVLLLLRIFFCYVFSADSILSLPEHMIISIANNEVFFQMCLRSNKQMVVVPKTSSSSDTSWMGLTKYIWSGWVLARLFHYQECITCWLFYKPGCQEYMACF